MTRSLLRALIALTFLVGVGAAYHSWVKGFFTVKVLSPFEPEPVCAAAIPSEPLLEQIDAVLRQRFHYLAKGAQCFAFQSEDGRYVLKMVKQYRVWPREWWADVPLPSALHAWRDRKIAKANDKRQQWFASFKFIEENLKEENGVLHLQSFPSKVWDRSVTLVDAAGFSHTVNLAKTTFILQKKAETFEQRLKKRLENDDLQGAIADLHAFLGLLQGRLQRGICDHDRKVLDNYGFCEDQAMAIDVGNFYVDESVSHPQAAYREIERMAQQLKEFLEKRSPALHLALSHELDALRPGERVDSREESREFQ